MAHPVAEQMESYAIYLIINIGNNSSTKWGFSLPQNVRNNQLIKMALTLNGLYRERNFVRFFRLFKKLPLLLKFAAHWNIPHVLRYITLKPNHFKKQHCSLSYLFTQQANLQFYVNTMALQIEHLHSIFIFIIF